MARFGTGWRYVTPAKVDPVIEIKRHPEPA
jgi:hypothetical protein